MQRAKGIGHIALGHKAHSLFALSPEPCTLCPMLFALCSMLHALCHILDMYTDLFLIRHGETDYNKEGKYCSFTDITLNGKGILQVFELQKKIKDISPDIIFSSSHKRALQTAEILFPQKKIELAEELKELNFGLWEGLNYQEIYQRYRELYTKWLSDFYKYTPPQGERMEDFEKRIVNFLNKVSCNYSGRKIVFVTHGGVIKVLSRYLSIRESHDFWKIDVEPASISHFKLEGSKVIL